MKFNESVPALILLVALVGCGGSGGSSVPGWQAPGAYEFTLGSSCGERALVGTFRVVVENGSVVEAEGLDESARAMLQHSSRDEVPTLSELLDQAGNAKEQGADVVEVRTADDGRPIEVDIDWDTDAVDDEACYRVTDYTSAS